MRIDVNLPKEWEDLTEDQLLFVVKQFSLKLSRVQFLTFCFLEFSGWAVVRDRNDECHFRAKRQVFTLEPGVFNELCEKLKWLIDKSGSCSNLKKIGRARCCDVDLEDVILDRYLFADAYFQMYHLTNNRKYLAILAAALYLKKWQRFNAAKIVKRRYKYFLKRPAQLEVVLLWYAGTKIVLKKKFPSLFKTSKEATGDFNAESIYRNTLSALNGGRVVDNSKILKVWCCDALKELDVLNENADKMKKK